MTAAADFARLIWFTLVQPAQVAQRVMQRSYDRGTLWMGVVLVCVLSVLLVIVMGAVTDITLPLGLTPLMYGLAMGCILIVLAMAFYLTGQMLGGTSTFPHAFALVIWLEMTSLVVRAVQSVVGLISPNAAGILSLAGIVALSWVMINFINETHGFQSLPRAFATIVIAIVGIGFGFGLFMSVIGLGAQLEI